MYNQELIRILMKKIGVNNYLIEQSRSDTILVKNKRTNGKILIYRNNLYKRLAECLLNYKMPFEKIVWLYNNQDVILIAKEINVISKRDIIFPLRLTNL